MAFEELLVTQFLAVGCMVGVAGWLLYVDINNRLHRSFALLLFLRALIILAAQVAKLSDASMAAVWRSTQTYVAIGTFFAVAYFFVVYNYRSSPRSVRIAGWTILAAAVVAEFLFAVRRDLFITQAERPVSFGPLGSLIVLGFMVSGLMAIWFALVANKTRSASGRFDRLMAIAFMATAITEGMIPWSFILLQGFDALGTVYSFSTGTVVYLFFSLLEAPAGLLAATLLVWNAVRTRTFVPAGVWTVAIAALAFAFAFVAAWPNPSRLDNFVSSFLVGTVRLFTASLVAYAIVRQQLSRLDVFSLDARLRLTLRRSTLAAIFVAAVFATAEVSVNALQSGGLPLGATSGVSSALSILVGGLLLVAIQPLQRWADRVSNSTMPRARPIADLTQDERAHLYRDQVELAWADGRLTVKERALLDQLRERMGLSLEEAGAIEARAYRRGLEPRA
ncbi:MAG TPA: hypothetical protein VI818_07780 [Candidatus Thermoplasmatota archaeon]|nr:hypothetical protein [Candidatus Thermoplasmatota archaeon]